MLRKDLSSLNNPSGSGLNVYRAVRGESDAPALSESTTLPMMLGVSMFFSIHRISFLPLPSTNHLLSMTKLFLFPFSLFGTCA